MKVFSKFGQGQLSSMIASAQPVDSVEYLTNLIDLPFISKIVIYLAELAIDMVTY